ncbi:uncharacterized protein LOC117629574 isoform X3 [Prunus dulcis]|uniref:uncharacterized protein LOC117629574 isoform X3 n=1 Tax=Prunus dulcis TaxID=3755 RepID=UPI001483B4D3|nr:uncharacterized protein LOC117629574 isoform X3 [Prunus dulcis]
MARFHPPTLHFAFFYILIALTTNPRLLLASDDDEFSIIDSDANLFHQDYSPPAPPPPPPHPPSVSCTDDLGGVGTLDATCKIVADTNLTSDVYIEGKGNFYILPGVRFYCSSPGCVVIVNITGNFSLGNSSSILAGAFELTAQNASFLDGSAVNTTALAGKPPAQTSGTPQGIEGAGGGHGGRGACCLVDETKLPEDVWGGDAYSWSTLQGPRSFGSRGGSTSREVDYGGLGGGRVWLEIKKFLVVNGSVLAEGGDGGTKGGGGSGGSIYIKARKMTGNGRISACGGNGYAGGGGGRVSVDVFSRHDDPEIFVHGGGSYACPENAGAAGTLYDAVPRSLFVNNHNKSTDTETLLLEFPFHPLWTNVYIENKARATVPLLWSRVQVQGQISLLSDGVLSFGLPHYASSEFELLAEELLMSDSVIKVYGALRMSVKMFLMWNSKMLIDGGGEEAVETSLLEASNLVVLRESSVIHSNANLGVHGQGLLNLSGPGDWIQAQRLVLSLFYSIHVGPGSVLRGPLENATSDSLTPKLYCENKDCPSELLHPPEDCNVNSSLSFTLQICRVEDIIIEGLVKGSVVHFHRARTIAIQSSGAISASGMGCTGGIGSGNILSNGSGSGGGHGGKGGIACYNGSCVEGGISYGNEELPCELGSGSGNDISAGSTAGGGIIGGVAEAPCPFKCISDRYHMPHCYTALEELIYTFGGPWLFGLLLIGLLILLALVLSVARMKFVGVDELPGPAPTQHGSQIDHSFPFLESLNEVLETNRAEESQSHVHRMYFMGPNTFGKPWHLPHTPPEQVKEIVVPSGRYEGPFNTFVDEINSIATYQWWEGAMYSILSVLAYPLAWSWQHWRRRLKLQRLREFVRSEYDHACLRSCRSRALYEGIKVAATSDLMLAYVDFFLGGDEKRTDLPPRLHQRFPVSLPFGGDGSYMAPFSLHSDNIVTSLMSQSVPPTTWYRMVAGLNAQLRLVCRGRLRVTLHPVLRWLESYANPALKIYGVRVDLAWFQATACGYCHYGLVVDALEEDSDPASVVSIDGAIRTEESRASSIYKEDSLGHLRETLISQSHRSSENLMRRKRTYGGIIEANNLQMLEEKRDIFYLLSFILHNTKPVGHQDLVGLVISMLLLGDFSLVLLTLLQLYSISLADVFLVLFILPLGILLPFPAGINALFSHGPRRSAGLARVHALWNLTSLINVVVAFVCGYVHYNTQSSNKIHQFQPWNISMDESEWWIFPAGLLLCKIFQSQLINWHVANLEIQDRSLYSNDVELFWQS